MDNKDIVSMLKKIQQRCEHNIERHKPKIEDLENTNRSMSGEWELGYFKGMESVNDDIAYRLGEILNKMKEVEKWKGYKNYGHND